MTRRGFAWFMAGVLVAAFLAANGLVGVVLRGARLDLTADRLYTLSDGTRRVLAELNEPIDLTFYYSAGVAARHPAIAAYASRVREMLQSYAGRGGGQIRLHEAEPARFSEEEDAASAAGIIPAESGGETLYFGLAGVNAADEHASIAAFSPAREAYLEYDITRLIAQLQAPTRANVAIISSLPLSPDDRAPLFFSELSRSAQVQVLPRDFTTIPDSATVLALLQPWPLSQAQLYAVDQFLMRKGRAFVAVDPAAMTWDEGPASPFGPPPVVEPKSDLNALLGAWGVSVSGDVIADGKNALGVRTADALGRPAEAPQPLFFKTPATQMARDDLITAGLSRQINFAAPGAVTITQTGGLTATPLVTTSRDTMLLPADAALARPSPQDVARAFHPSGKQETIAVRVSGIAPSAFGAAPPLGISATGHLTKSARAAEIVVVADADFLNDAFYVSEARAPFADNGAFVLNALDLLSGDDALVSLRSRAPSARPLEMIDRMRGEAGARTAATQERLRKEIEDTETRLANLQQTRAGSFDGALGAERTAAERALADGFRARVLALRNELRASERDLRRSIEALQGWLIFVNVWLAPLLVIGAGAFVFWRRRARSEGRV
ncbi:MAG: GldG family protein [Alphaproteobacteria bacterium]